MVVDINIINEYVEKGLVEKNSHPTLPIAIYNYSREVQYEGKWDNITKMCRALVLDNNGNVIAKGFDKFFNMEEHQVKSQMRLLKCLRKWMVHWVYYFGMRVNGFLRVKVHLLQTKQLKVGKCYQNMIYNQYQKGIPL